MSVRSPSDFTARQSAAPRADVGAAERITERETPRRERKTESVTLPRDAQRRSACRAETSTKSKGIGYSANQRQWAHDTLEVTGSSPVSPIPLLCRQLSTIGRY